MITKTFDEIEILIVEEELFPAHIYLRGKYVKTIRGESLSAATIGALATAEGIVRREIERYERTAAAIGAELTRLVVARSQGKEVP